PGILRRLLSNFPASAVDQLLLAAGASAVSAAGERRRGCDDLFAGLRLERHVVVLAEAAANVCALDSENEGPRTARHLGPRLGTLVSPAGDCGLRRTGGWDGLLATTQKLGDPAELLVGSDVSSAVLARVR